MWKYDSQMGKTSAAKWAELFGRQMGQNSAAKLTKLQPPNGLKFGRQIDHTSATKWAKIRPPNGPKLDLKIHQVFFISLIKLHQPFILQQNF
jgi:hypothetical protein